MLHTHNWQQAYTEQKDGSVTRIIYRCRNDDCDYEDEIDDWRGKGWKEVEGKGDDRVLFNEWKNNPSRITR